MLCMHLSILYKFGQCRFFFRFTSKSLLSRTVSHAISRPIKMTCVLVCFASGFFISLLNSKQIYKGGYSASKTTLFVYVCHVFFYSRILLLHRTTSISNSSHTYLGNYRSYRSQYLHVSNRRQILQYLLQLANFRHRHHVTSLRFLDLMHVSAKCLKYQLYYEIYLCKCIYLIRWVFQFLETLLRSENIYSSHIPRSFLEIFFNR